MHKDVADGYHENNLHFQDKRNTQIQNIYVLFNGYHEKKNATESTMQDKVIPDKRNYCKNEKKFSLHARRILFMMYTHAL